MALSRAPGAFTRQSEARQNRDSGEASGPNARVGVGRIARHVGLGITLLSQVLSGCAEDTQSSAGAKLAVIVPRSRSQPVEVSHDFGVVKTGDTVVHTFQIRNSTDAEWAIDEITPSCACAIARVSSRHVNPGDHLEVEVALSAGQRVMDSERRVDIKLESESTPYIRLLLKAKVRTDLTIWPRTLDFGFVPEGRIERVSNAALVSNYSSDEFEGLTVEETPEWLEVQITPFESTPSDGGPQEPKQKWELLCIASPQALTQGAHRHQLQIRTLDGAHSASIPIVCEIQPRMLVVPEVVSIAGMRAGETVERTVLVRMLDPESAAAPQVSVLDERDPRLGVDAKVVQASATMWKVVLQVSVPPASSGANLKRSALVSVPESDDPPQPIEIIATFAN